MDTSRRLELAGHQNCAYPIHRSSLITMLAMCMACIDANSADPAATFENSLEPSFGQFIQYCASLDPSSIASGIVESTTVATTLSVTSSLLSSPPKLHDYLHSVKVTIYNHHSNQYPSFMVWFLAPFLADWQLLLSEASTGNFCDAGI
ncbi:hypothetical protein BOTNAR_0420g00060 [Botryotinia narcissicola]|uniref:Uncharacterized protein n=1 Tax=Botryotinia narcissicola TaxID=278944 RepID=A0A4Z1HM48_9HELO|nr:hypothetical protein BOTNAR_0420g00060 [Botryotinia narcissicola]